MGVTLEKGFDFFLKNEFEEYKDVEGVAIYGNNIISHGSNLKKVISKAKQTAPISKVLLSKVKKTASFL